METKRLLILGGLVVLAALLVLIFFRSGGEERIKQVSTKSPEGQTQFSAQPSAKRTITLFFLSEEDSLLHPEEREILDNSSLVLLAERTIEELLRGSQGEALSSLPEETKLRGIFITKEGIAYVDFSGEIQEGHSSGSAAEIAAVFAVVNSLTFNFKAIKRVFILVDGNEKETLAGHIDLGRPLLPRYDLVGN